MTPLVSIQNLGPEKFQEGVREAIKKGGLVMEFFSKGGGVLDPIHNYGAHFCASRVKELCLLNRGLWTLLGTLPKSLFKIWPF